MIYKDITGQKFGLLEVTGMVKKGALYHAVCKCACGKVVVAAPGNLRKGRESCGCIPRSRKPALIDLTGQTFGHLVVVGMQQLTNKATTGGKGGAYYAICKCLKCGKQDHPVIPTSLRRGASTSCGCNRYDCYCIKL